MRLAPENLRCFSGLLAQLLALALLGLAAGQVLRQATQFSIQSRQGLLLLRNAQLLLVGLGGKISLVGVFKSPAKRTRLAGLQLVAVGVEVGQSLLSAQLPAVAFEQPQTVAAPDFQVSKGCFDRGQRGRLALNLGIQGFGSGLLLLGSFDFGKQLLEAL